MQTVGGTLLQPLKSKKTKQKTSVGEGDVNLVKRKLFNVQGEGFKSFSKISEQWGLFFDALFYDQYSVFVVM